MRIKREYIGIIACAIVIFIFSIAYLTYRFKRQLPKKQKSESKDDEMILGKPENLTELRKILQKEFDQLRHGHDSKLLEKPQKYKISPENEHYYAIIHSMISNLKYLQTVIFTDFEENDILPKLLQNIFCKIFYNKTANLDIEFEMLKKYNDKHRIFSGKGDDMKNILKNLDCLFQKTIADSKKLKEIMDIMFRSKCLVSSTCKKCDTKRQSLITLEFEIQYSNNDNYDYASAREKQFENNNPFGYVCNKCQGLSTFDLFYKYQLTDMIYLTTDNTKINKIQKNSRQNDLEFPKSEIKLHGNTYRICAISFKKNDKNSSLLFKSTKKWYLCKGSDFIDVDISNLDVEAEEFDVVFYRIT